MEESNSTVFEDDLLLYKYMICLCYGHIIYLTLFVAQKYEFYGILRFNPSFSEVKYFFEKKSVKNVYKMRAFTSDSELTKSEKLEFSLWSQERVNFI